MIGRTRTRAVGVCALVAGVIASVVVPAGTSGAVIPKVAVTYGNTLTWESQQQIANRVRLKSGWSVTQRSFPGIGFCTWNTWIEQDLATYQPAVVSVASMSNPPDVNNPGCGVDENGQALVLGSDGYFADFTANVREFFGVATSSGAHVVYFASAPVRDPVRNEVLVRQNQIAKAVAGEFHGVSYSNGVRNTLSKSGKYTDYKPCLTVEAGQPDCIGGTIPIRTLTAPIQAGNHLCPGGLPSEYPWFCPTYSSGAYRFAVAVVNGIVNPPRPILP